jgi:hypothetical protein
MRKLRLCLLAAVLAGVLAVLPAYAAQETPLPGLPQSANELVREAIHNELNDNDPTHYMYRLVKKTPDGSETREVIETRDLIVARLLARNGEPLTPEEQQKEDQRLRRLLTDSSYLRSKQKSQHEDDQRTRRMVQALPDAFVYQYLGVKPQLNGQLVVLYFKPNPNYDAPSRELQVYSGMAGTMEISLPARRLALIDATLFRDVTFGWGIFGRLNEGGRFLVEQSRVHDHHWEPTHMVLHFDGKVLLFKTLKIRQDQTTSGYRPVPAMSVAQALEFLKQQDGEIARTQGSKEE